MKPANYTPKYSFLGIFVFLMVFSSCTSSTNELTFAVDREDPKTLFAIAQIRAALEQNGLQLRQVDRGDADLTFALDAEDNEMMPEGYKIKKPGNSKIKIYSTDEAGAMYGGLELAEQIELYGWEGVKETSQNPYMEMRGSKFNIPLDVRTPSYTDMCDAAQNNIEEMWSLDFWKEYIDNMARYRYNYVSLWSLQPFPSMVKTPGYEDISLSNVERSKGPFKEYYPLIGVGFDPPELLSNTEVLKEISIEEKMDFWREVMAYGKSRNVDFYVITWNVFTYGIDGKYGITDDVNNPVTRDYYRKSVTQMFRTYPDLAGIGLTTGENMRRANKKINSAEKEDWAYDTYAEGILTAAREMPKRKFKFIHRQHQTGAREIAEKFQPIYDQKNVDFLFSFKYAQAHVYSSTRQPYHEKFVEEIKGLKTIWTLRNDDIYYFRWGAPDFVREFIQNIPYDVSTGYYYGSDQWVWGREFTSKNTNAPRQLEVVKHWYHWMMWGRLGFNPGITNQRFIDILQVRFPGIDAQKLFDAWQEASMIYPTTTGFHWGDLDFKWYIEGCKSHINRAETESGFHCVDKFISLPPHKLSGYQSIPDYVAMTIDSSESGLLSPLQVAEKLHRHSDAALAMIESLSEGGDKEFQLTLHDIHTIALMGKYYAHKIAGSTYVALYRNSKDHKWQKQAVEELTKALAYWKLYTKTAMEEHNNPIWTNRVGYVDWARLTKDVENDIAIAKKEA
jgi:hypothetical protein